MKVTKPEPPTLTAAGTIGATVEGVRTATEAKAARVRFDAEAFLARFWAMDAALVSAGFPAISPWWRAQIERFVRSGCRRWVIRAGRRAGKSTTLSRLAVAWAWFGEWSVPAGDRAVIPFVSVSKDEASARLATISALLRALHLEFHPRGDELELTGPRTVIFRVISCTTSAVVGFTSIAVFGDEVARWESRDTMANPARDVIGSLMPTLATQEHGFAVLCSSPWGTDDYHAELFDQGDTEHQVVSHAATWVANPTISEARTHELEPDPRVWSREYAAEPGATVSQAIDSADVVACYGGNPTGKRCGGFVAIDPSSLVGGDEYAFIAGYATDAGELVVDDVGGWDGAHVTFETVIEEIAARATRFGTRVVFSDHFEQGGAAALYRAQRLVLQVVPWSETSKHEAMTLLRTLMRTRKVFLPDHKVMRSELLGLKARLAPSGRTHYATGGLDYASALITLAHAIVAGEFTLGGSRWVFPSQYSAVGRLGLHEPSLRRDQGRGSRWSGSRGRGF
ncbi:MAG TPA: hypothetical protein VHE30_25945 [Polyangiaceae bacterium]|nr:hypothetical protein [Polyangiaceae bacterium]